MDVQELVRLVRDGVSDREIVALVGDNLPDEAVLRLSTEQVQHTVAAALYGMLFGRHCWACKEKSRVPLPAWESPTTRLILYGQGRDLTIGP